MTKSAQDPTLAYLNWVGREIAAYRNGRGLHHVTGVLASAAFEYINVVDRGQPVKQAPIMCRETVWAHKNLTADTSINKCSEYAGPALRHLVIFCIQTLAQEKQHALAVEVTDSLMHKKIPDAAKAEFLLLHARLTEENIGSDGPALQGIIEHGAKQISGARRRLLERAQRVTEVAHRAEAA